MAKPKAEFGSYETSMMEFFTEIVNRYKLLTVFVKKSASLMFDKALECAF